MSHTDDPTKTPEQAQQPALTLPDLTKREIVEELEKATGKTAGELFLLPENELTKIVSETFDKEKTDNDDTKTDDDTDKTATSEKTDSSTAKPVSDEEVTVLIKPSLIGPTNGKNIKEALAEALERGRSAESAAELFKSQTIPRMENEIKARDERLSAISSENNDLRSQLEELRKKPVVPPVDEKTKPAEQDEDALPEVPEIPKEYDPFDPEHHSKIADAINTLRKRDEIFQKRLKEKAREPQPQSPAPDPEKPASNPPVEKQTDEERRVAAANSEIAAVRALQSDPTIGETLRTTRDIAEINNDYVGFGEKLARMCGIQQALDQNGLFTQAASGVIALFFDQDNPEGSKIRAAAQINKIAPPSVEDMNALKRVSIVRGFQNSRFTRDRSGNVVPISANEAFALASREHPALFASKDPVTSRKQELDAEQRALENRQGHSTEIPPALGADLSSGKSIMPQDQLLRLIQKGKDRTADEQLLLIAECKRQGLSDEEIKLLT
jgi:hypothetical protein